MPTPPDALAPLRKEIEALDRRVVALLNKRLQVSTRIGAIKREQRTHNSPFDANREESLLRLLVGENPGPLSAASLRAVYREIFSSSRARQSLLTIGYLDTHDPKWKCGHHTPLLAACARFGVEENYRPVSGVKQLLRETARGELTLSLLCAAAVVDHGAEIARTLHVCGEVALRHALPPAGKGKNKKGGEPLPFFLLTRQETAGDAAAAPLLPGTRLLLLASGLGRKASGEALARWCRTHRVRLRILSGKGGTALVDLHIPERSKAAALPPLARLEAGLRESFGPAARLHLLGSYLAEATA